MHHGENNSYPGDLSGTECYERDNPLHWVLYWLRHACMALFEVPLWSLERVRYKEFTLEAMGGFLYLFYLSAFYNYNPRAAVTMAIGPFLFTTAAFMFGNFSQHCLVNPKNARSSFGLSYNIIDAPINRGFWNDGYHLIHHLNSQIPWHAMPQAFVDMQERIAKNGGLTFRNTIFQKIFFWSLTGQYDKIHAHFVPLSEEQDMTPEEFAEFIQPWYTPIYDKSLPRTWYTDFLKATSRREPIYIDYKAVKGEKK